jgi:hypothetical protein
MLIIRSIFVFVLVAAITGCATPASVGGMTANADLSAMYSQPLQNNIQVATVVGGEETNPLWTSEVDGESFESALKQSLNNAALLNDSSSSKFILQTNLLKVDQPTFGLDLQVTIVSDYILTDRNSRKVVFKEKLVTPFTAGVGDSLLAGTRLRLANEGAAKANIKELLQRLSVLQIKTVEISSNTPKPIGISKDQQILDLQDQNLSYQDYVRKFREIEAQ